MASKSKRTKVDLSPEAILREVQEGKAFLSSITNLKSQLNIKAVKEILKIRKKKEDFDFDILGLLAFMHGFDTVMWVMAAMQHVPQAFARRENTRASVIFDIVNSLLPEKGLTTALVEEISCFIDEFIPNFSVLGSKHCHFEKALQNLTKKGKMNYNHFIAPPVQDCLTCGKKLSAPNALSSCTLYTIGGPKPSTKITLRCKDCKVSYDRSMITNGNGTSTYYPNEIANQDGLVKVTNVVFMEKKLYNWIPSLM